MEIVAQWSSLVILVMLPRVRNSPYFSHKSFFFFFQIVERTIREQLIKKCNNLNVILST